VTTQQAEVHEEQRAAQPAAVIRTKVDIEHIPERLGECFGEIMGVLGRRGIAPAGEPYVRYLSPPPGEMAIEVGVPVARPVAADGRVEPGELPAGSVAVAIHRGPYERIAETYGVVMRWIAEHGRAPDGPMWECYRTDPQAEPDPAKWETEIVQPIA
jgi:effector-binding domain-containing protein